MNTLNVELLLVTLLHFNWHVSNKLVMHNTILHEVLYSFQRERSEQYQNMYILQIAMKSMLERYLTFKQQLRCLHAEIILQTSACPWCQRDSYSDIFAKRRYSENNVYKRVSYSERGIIEAKIEVLLCM